MATDYSALFGALADTRRRAILTLLHGRTLTVNRIAEEFSVSRPAISRHLRVLRETGLVSESKRGRERFYALEPEAIGEAVEHLKPYLARGPEKPSVPAKRSRRKKPQKARSAKPRSAEVPSEPPASGRRNPKPDKGWRCW